ncbi:MAG: hypothetical protein K6F00_09630 [Lachnospiraceae bacterium]|nr:hypothetical protein [Lachnospiraceae bacterium]
MKKIIVMLLFVVAAGSFIACGGQGAENRNSTSSGVEDVLEAGMAEADKEEEDIAEPEERESGLNEDAPLPEEETDEALSTTEGIDIDLTQLSETMVYSEVFNMMMEPDQYKGKTIRMNGTTSYFKDENTGKVYYSCVIQDATACCAQGIEFVLTDDYKPDDYPKDGDNITVTGVFDTYNEDEKTYCTLKDASLEEI